MSSEIIEELKKAVKSSLTQNSEILAGKQIKFSEKCGKKFNWNYLDDFSNGEDDVVLVLINHYYSNEFINEYHILISLNIPWISAGKIIESAIRKKFGINCFVLQNKIDEKALEFTIEL